jgi:hypothetical protein
MRVRRWLNWRPGKERIALRGSRIYFQGREGKFMNRHSADEFILMDYTTEFKGMSGEACAIWEWINNEFPFVLGAIWLFLTVIINLDR